MSVEEQVDNLLQGNDERVVKKHFNFNKRNLSIGFGSMVVSALLVTMLVLPVSREWMSETFFGVKEETVSSVGGGVIINDSVTWSNDYGSLTVTPHTSTNIITQEQEALFESNITANIDIAFRFNDSLSNKDIWMWKNISHNVSVPDYGNITANYTLVNISDFSLIGEPESVMLGDIPSDYYAIGNASYWDDIVCEWMNTTFTIGFDSWEWLNPEHTECKFTYEYWGITGYHYEEQYWFDWWNINHLFNYQEYNGKHYYYVTDVSVVQDKSYLFKWQYDTPLVNGRSSGKWDLMAKLHSETIQEALSSGHYVMLDPWWDTDWSYYKYVTITNPMADYQTMINITYSSGGDVNCEGHAQSDFDDLRFVYDNTTELPYWFESVVSNNYVHVWVNNTGNYSGFQMFYGNASATNNSDGNTTFDFFDDFNYGSQPDSNKWTETDPNSRVDVSGGELRIIRTAPGSAAYALLYSVPYFTYNFSMDIRTITYDDQAGTVGLAHLTYHKLCLTPTEYLGLAPGYSNAANQERVYLRRYISGAGADGSGTLYYPWGSYRVVSAWWDGVTHGIRINRSLDPAFNLYQAAAITRAGQLRGTFSDSTVSSDYDYDIRYDWLLVRKYVNTSAPSFSFGDEISQSPANTAPLNSNNSPSNGATGISLIPTLTIKVSDVDAGDLMNVTFRTNATGSWGDIGTNNSVANPSWHNWTNASMNQANTTYYWSVNTSDGNGGWDNDTFSFTTLKPPDQPFIIFPDNQSTDVDIGADLSWDCRDPEYPINNNFYTLSSNWTTFPDNPVNQHHFDPVHNNHIIEVNISIDGSVRKYVAYNSRMYGENISLWYTDDLDSTWTAYSGNPILESAPSQYYMWPSTTYINGTFHMFLTNKSTTYIERWISTDAINFTKVEEVVIGSPSTPTKNPFIWYNPLTEKWYLYFRILTGATNVIYNRNATNIEDLDGAANQSIIDVGANGAAPCMTYKDGVYWLLYEKFDGNNWTVKANYSYSSCESGFTDCTNSPILEGDRACPTFHLSPNGSKAYLFTDLRIGGAGDPHWYQNTREVYLNNLTYDVYLDTSSPPSKVFSNYTGISYNASLNYNTKYYWQIVAWDGDGLSNTSDIWEFTTESAPNTAPTQSGEVPANSSTDISTTPSLHVVCTDADSDTMTATWRSNSSGSWVQFATNTSISTGTNITQTNSNFSAYSTTYYWSVNLTDATDWLNNTYHFTTEAAPSWQVFSNTINGSIYNTSQYSIFSNTVNGSLYNTSQYSIISNNINGSIFNQSQYSVFSDTVNGSIYNSSQYTIFSNTVNGSVYNTSQYSIFSNTVNGSIYNVSQYSVFSSTMNGSIYNTSQYSVISNTVNGSIYNVSLYTAISNNINGSIYNTSQYSVFNSNINGSLWNVSAFSVFSDTVNGSVYNSTQFSVFSSNINGSIYNISIYTEISNTINGSIYNTSQYTIISNTINGSLWNVSQFTLFSDAINGTVYNSTQFSVFSSSINGTIHNISLYTSIDSATNGSIYNTSQYSIFSNTVNGSVYNTSQYSIISNNINGSIFNQSQYSVFSDTVNGSIYNSSQYTIFSNTVNGSIYNQSQYSILFNNINGSLWNISAYTEISNTINGSLYNSSPYTIVQDDINGSIYNISAAELDITSEYPTNGSNILIVQPTLYFNLTSPTGLTMNYTIWVGASAGNCNTKLYDGVNVNNGTQFDGDQLYYSAVNFTTSYWWRVSANDGTTSINETYFFNCTKQGGGGITNRLGTSIAMGLLAGLAGSIIFGLLFVKKKKERGR